MVSNSYAVKILPKTCDMHSYRVIVSRQKECPTTSIASAPPQRMCVANSRPKAVDFHQKAGKSAIRYLHLLEHYRGTQYYVADNRTKYGREQIFISYTSC